MAVKTFTDNTTLPASDINTFLANSGLVCINTFTATGTTVLSCDNVFSSTYTNYRVVINMRGVSDLNVLLLTYINSAGSDVTSSYYSAAIGWDYTGTGTTAHVFNSTSSVALAFLVNASSTTTNRTGVSLDIYDPVSATAATFAAGNYSSINSGAYYSAGMTNSSQITGTSMRGFKLKANSANNITGTCTVYGYRTV